MHSGLAQQPYRLGLRILLARIAEPLGCRPESERTVLLAHAHARCPKPVLLLMGGYSIRHPRKVSRALRGYLRSESSRRLVGPAPYFPVRSWPASPFLSLLRPACGCARTSLFCVRVGVGCEDRRLLQEGRRVNADSGHDARHTATLGEVAALGGLERQRTPTRILEPRYSCAAVLSASATSKQQRGLAPRSQHSRTDTPASSEIRVSTMRHASGWSGVTAASGQPYPRMRRPPSRSSSSARPPSSFSAATASSVRARAPPSGVPRPSAMRRPTPLSSASDSCGPSPSESTSNSRPRTGS